MTTSWIPEIFEKPRSVGNITIGMTIDKFLEILGALGLDLSGDKFANLAYIAKHGRLSLVEMFPGGEEEIKWERIGLHPTPCSLDTFLAAVPENALFVEVLQNDPQSPWLSLIDQNGVNWVFRKGTLFKFSLSDSMLAAPHSIDGVVRSWPWEE